nr:hypothetical protein [Solimonas soli]
MATRLVCPLCTYEQQRVLGCSRDNAAVLVLEIEGGCGCSWQLRFERVEARTQATVRIVRPCLQRSGLQPLADAAEAGRLLDEHEL